MISKGSLGLSGIPLAICLYLHLFSSVHAAVRRQSSTGTGKLPSALVHKQKRYRPDVQVQHDSFSPMASSHAFDASRVPGLGNAEVEGGGFLQPEQFPDAEYCSRCHEEAHSEWRESLHSNSFRTPFYQRSVGLLRRTKGVQLARQCDSCHNPISVLSGEFALRVPSGKSYGRDGVTCMVCHSIQKVDKLGDGSFTLATPSVLVSATGERIPGRVADGEILAHPDRHARAVMQDIYKTPEFCSSCHKASVSVALNDYKWMRIFSTYDEWQQSQFSQETPLNFYPSDFRSCQTCHMQRVTVSHPDASARDGMLASHNWVAGNTAVPFYLGYQAQLRKTSQFLKSGVLSVDIFAVKSARSREVVAPLGLSPFAIQKNDTLTVSVVISNQAIGHSLLPELRDLYESWVRFSVEDASGRTIYQSGAMKPDGTVELSAHRFVNDLIDSAGNVVEDHQVWTARATGVDNTIQAGRSTIVRYVFRLPQKYDGPITVRAAVEYRHLRQSYLNSVLGSKHAAYPVIELAAAARVIRIGSDTPADRKPNGGPEWMRWNDAGIGYLGGAQYEEALRAFGEVLRLRPDYADGYVNVALTLIEEGRPRDAAVPIQEALAYQPGFARALYYRALIERAQSQHDAEIADLKEVVTQYPMARDARRELGMALLQSNENVEAVKQFKALQMIDPDDLSAHLNLAVLYGRLGMKRESSEENTQYAAQKQSSGAPTYSPEYLRKHPEVANEVSPWHLHFDTQVTAAR